MSDEVAVVYVPRFEAMMWSHPCDWNINGMRNRIFVRDNMPMPGAKPRLMCECESASDAKDIADALNTKHNGHPPKSTT